MLYLLVALFLIALVAFVVSLRWLISKKDFEPLLAVLGAVSGIILTIIPIIDFFTNKQINQEEYVFSGPITIISLIIIGTIFVFFLFKYRVSLTIHTTQYESAELNSSSDEKGTQILHLHRIIIRIIFFVILLGFCLIMLSGDVHLDFTLIVVPTGMPTVTPTLTPTLILSTSSATPTFHMTSTPSKTMVPIVSSEPTSSATQTPNVILTLIASPTSMSPSPTPTPIPLVTATNTPLPPATPTWTRPPIPTPTWTRPPIPVPTDTPSN